jgi:tRNA (mo5U34)-methyltransferase
MDPAELGRFDVVLFLGILYHMEEPLTALRCACRFLASNGILGIETEAIEIPGAPDAAFFEFFPSDELNNDASNWWAPNAVALRGLVAASGLQNFQLKQGPPPSGISERSGAAAENRRIRYRAIATAHAPG